MRSSGLSRSIKNWHARQSLNRLKEKGTSGATVKVGLIGLGVIGSRVGAKLAEADSLHSVYNRTRSKSEAFSKGRVVRQSGSIEELVRDCDVVVTVLSDDEAVLD